MTSSIVHHQVSKTTLSVLLMGATLAFTSGAGHLDVQDKAKAEAKDQKKPEAKPQAKAEAKPQAKADTKPQAKADTKPQAKAEAKPQAKPTSPQSTPKQGQKTDVKPAQLSLSRIPTIRRGLRSRSQPCRRKSRR